MQDVSTSLIGKFVSEIGEMQNQIIELDKIKVELEEELGLLKCVEEESREVKASLDEQLTNSHAKNKFLSDNLEHEIEERKRDEEEFHAVKASLEEQLAKRESEMHMLMNNLKSERQVFEQKWDNLQQQFNTWFNSIFEGRQ